MLQKAARITVSLAALAARPSRRTPHAIARDVCSITHLALLYTRNLLIVATMANFDLFAGNFEFADFTGFNNSIVEQPLQGLPQSHAASYPVPSAFTSDSNAAFSPVTPGFDQPHGMKRKLDSVEPSSEQPLDEAARVAAEEDKRRRNTAASARFRIKKKQREQALEKTAKDMTDRVNLLEARIQQLETENTWLKGLITEKNGGSKSASDISAMLKRRTEGSDIEKSRTDGVGTSAEGTKA
jgi:hypothetical protein